ncbi:MAG: hypothetical protein AVDCRST_MAG17-1770 [uncultured Solirubrobacterales bacterium]|uniref:Uncharacterized protein n=1 Tax=uncultured Solirubrobacterales bacterium TaxID=768556 RepID=A0A6J4SX13_9ACTN|nr:MAG: hypothetical protein AVDCRST_MAG17-1770 [uncultured Solirubrobacterales bacterium]
MAALTRTIRLVCVAGYAAFPDLFTAEVEGPPPEGSA